MIIIYDFDGTLTPYSLPQYESFKKCGYEAEDVQVRVKEELDKGSENMYVAYFKCYRDILEENGMDFTKKNICLGAENIEYNKGVIDFFSKYQSSNCNIKNYIVTSGIVDYIDSTVIRKYIDGVYGVILDYSGESSDKLVTDKGKVEAIKQIHSENVDDTIIYFGDGLTDKFAFEYVHEIGGITVFIASNKDSLNYYNSLNKEGIIDKYFKADFSSDGEIDIFISSLIEK